MGVNDIYVVVPSYEPNTATTNRMMAFLRGFSEQGVNTIVTFLVSNSIGSEVQETMPHVEFRYMWKGFVIKNSIINKLQLEFNGHRFVQSLPTGANVFLPWPSSRLLNILVKRHDINVFYEETELPELYTMRSFSINSYLKSIKKLKGLFVISSSLREYFIQKGVDKKLIHIVNMIVDSNRFLSVEKREQRDIYIAYCGNSSNSKDGVDDLIKAFSHVLEKHPMCKLYIGGRVPIKEEYDSNLVLIERLGIKENVVHYGIVSYKEMPQLLKDATILALDRPETEQAKYGFPTKLGEYLLTGNPVVVTRVGDIPLFLKDGESAFLSESKNEIEFAEKLCWVLDHPSESNIIGEKGKAVAMKYFNYVTESSKIIECIFNRKLIS